MVCLVVESNTGKVVGRGVGLILGHRGGPMVKTWMHDVREAKHHTT